MTFHAGSTLGFEIRDAAGVAGIDFDQIHLTDGLYFNGGDTELSAITIDITSLGLDNLPGFASSFDQNGSYSFEFLIADGGIFGFDPNQFHIDSTHFLNAPNSNRFYVSSSGNGLFVNFSAVPELNGFIVLAATCIAFALRRLQRKPSSE